jgi:hypothetical protein
LCGNANLSSYWKINLNNLKTDLTDNDVIVIHVSDGENETTKLFNIDMSQGVNLINLNLESIPPDNETQNAIVPIYEGWTLFSLPLNPINIENSEELGQRIMDSGNISCEVIMKFNGKTQLWEDDIFGLGDPTFSLLGTEGYYIHCDETFNFTYQGVIWE